MIYQKYLCSKTLLGQEPVLVLVLVQELVLVLVQELVLVLVLTQELVLVH